MGIKRHLRSWSLTVLAGALLAISWASTALAQASGGDGDGGDGDEFSALAVMIGVAAVAAVAWFAVMFSRQSGHSHHGFAHANHVPSPPSSDAMKILNERFAKGEIDAEEFTKRRDLLQSSP